MKYSKEYRVVYLVKGLRYSGGNDHNHLDYVHLQPLALLGARS